MKTYNLSITIFDLVEEKLFDEYPGMNVPKMIEQIMYDRNFPCEVSTTPTEVKTSNNIPLLG